MKDLACFRQVPSDHRIPVLELLLNGRDVMNSPHLVNCQITVIEPD
ncbi:hypothetical protein ABID08_001909 [Rhizobium binae]|uniref:Uncharacterized protein n=1 Tax=Rhizobium binae TaxID=1138190 RepID=A0ABV2MDK9_9HYPH